MSDGGLLKRIQSESTEDPSDLLEILEEDTEASVEDVLALVDSGTCLIENWLVGQNRGEIPIALIDAELKIRWRNPAFRNLRETKGLVYHDRPFPALFTTFVEKDYLNVLIRQLKDPESGFQWRGPVNGLGHGMKAFTADLFIIPYVVDDEGIPVLYQAILNDLTERKQESLRRQLDSILQVSLAKDDDTGNHVERVNSYSRTLATSIQGRPQWPDVDEAFIEDIGYLAAFHDVGKIGTPDAILQKPGKLTGDEWATMKEHPIQGALFLAAFEYRIVYRSGRQVVDKMAVEIPRSHHEKWDGTGYPYELAGEDIPLAARIVAIADVYDALRTKRPYKEAFSEKKTAAIIMEDAGKHFDPALVEEFKKLRKEFDTIFKELTDN